MRSVCAGVDVGPSQLPAGHEHIGICFLHGNGSGRSAHWGLSSYEGHLRSPQQAGVTGAPALRGSWELYVFTAAAALEVCDMLLSL